MRLAEVDVGLTKFRADGGAPSVLRFAKSFPHAFLPRVRGHGRLLESWHGDL
jgi:hypothetical protein